VALVDDTTTTAELATPLKLTVIGATKFVPVSVTIAPSFPDVGAKTLIVGAAANAPTVQNDNIARMEGRMKRSFRFMAFFG
jgi:hypothetical protein